MWPYLLVCKFGIEHEQCMYLITVPNMKKITTFFTDILQHSKCKKNGHNYSNLTQSQILFYLHQQPMVPDYCTQFEENPSSHHGRMHDNGHPAGWTDRWMNGWPDGQMDRQTEPFPIFPDST